MGIKKRKNMYVNSLIALKSDTYRQFGRFNWRLVIWGALTSRTFRVIVMMRLCQAIAKSKGLIRLSLPLFMILYRIATHLATVDFSWRIEAGPGLNLVHGWGLVVDPDTKIGSNVTLFHGVTLGRRDRISPGGARFIEHPTLEDEVWIGPHAIIVGGVTIGQGSRIAGGAFITESVPPYSIVSGNPATIVKNNCVPDVMNPAPL